MIAASLGLNYGDEGKGKLISYLCQRAKNPIVLRCSAGPQCGHTVVHDGHRHVFGSFGSGTLQGAPTYFGPEFRLNPILFMKEYRQLEKFNPIVFVHPHCQLTTPYDVFVNQELERSRGNDNHGSCGMGIGETVQRIEDGFSYNLTDSVLRTLERITEVWLPQRLKKLSLNPDMSLLSSASDRFYQDLEAFQKISQPVFPENLPSLFNSFLFEGNQGLLLDQNSDDFPHVTRANTGLTDILKLLTEAGIDQLPHVYYNTRCYSTRHGAGPFKEIPNPGVTDNTNVTNEFQQNFKYGYLDFERMKNVVEKDSGQLQIEKTVVINHMDQLEPFGLSQTQTIKNCMESVGTGNVKTGHSEHSFYKD